MSYTANIYDATNPTDSVIAETAQAEFRAIKGFYQGVVGRAPLVNILNTSAVTPVFSVVVPANSLGTNKRLRYTTWGTIVNSGVGAGGACSLAASFGANSLFSNLGIITPGNGSFAWKLVLEMINLNNVVAQGLSVMLHMFATSSAGGVAQASVAGYPIGATNDALVVNTAVDQNFGVTGQLNSGANLGINFDANILEWA